MVLNIVCIWKIWGIVEGSWGVSNMRGAFFEGPCDKDPSLEVLYKGHPPGPLIPYSLGFP